MAFGLKKNKISILKIKQKWLTFKGCDKPIGKDAYSLLIVMPNISRLPPIPEGQEYWPPWAAIFASTVFP